MGPVLQVVVQTHQGVDLASNLLFTKDNRWYLYPSLYATIQCIFFLQLTLKNKDPTHGKKSNPYSTFFLWVGSVFF